jgi:hypothetical protein
MCFSILKFDSINCSLLFLKDLEGCCKNGLEGVVRFSDHELES